MKYTGFKLLDTNTGINAKMQLFAVDASNAVVLGRGGEVKLVNDGTTTTVNGMSAASDDFVGIVQAVFGSTGAFGSENGAQLDYLPVSTAGFALVSTSPTATYGIQADAAASQAVMGDAADSDYGVVVTGTGNSATKLDIATLAGDGAAAQWRILDKIDTSGNDWGDSDVMLVVTPLEHAYNSTPNAI